MKYECVGRINAMFTPQNVFGSSWGLMRAMCRSFESTLVNQSTHRIYWICIILKIRAEVSSKKLHAYPKFILLFFNSPSFALCCWVERWREVFLLWTRKCCFWYMDSLSHLELLSGITRMPLTWLPFTCPFVQYYPGKIAVKWQ